MHLERVILAPAVDAPGSVDRAGMRATATERGRGPEAEHGVREVRAAGVEAGADEVNIALRAPWHEEALDAYLTDVMPKVRAAVG